MKKTKKTILKKACKGKGGSADSPFGQASSPIDLLKTNGEPPTASSIPRTNDNSLGNKVTS
jgi:hypothetical protein